MTYADIALCSWNQEKKLARPNHYAYTLGMFGAARLALITGNRELLADVRRELQPFLSGAFANASGVYGKTVYRCGGSAAAYLYRIGELPEAEDTLRQHAEALYHNQLRDTGRTFCHPRYPQKPDQPHGPLWIDTTFGVCQFEVLLGQAFGHPEYIADACFQMKEHHAVLFDPATRLYHQAVNFSPTQYYSAFWGRGEGWGVNALIELIADLDPDHPDRPEFIKAYREAMAGCVAVQDADGMLHQVLTVPESYVETSGTGLVFYGMARGIDLGILDPEQYRAPLLAALRGMTRYIALDGSVFNCCRGCLSPGNGTDADYMAWNWVLNDDHAFGPVTLLFGAAEALARRGVISQLTE